MSRWIQMTMLLAGCVLAAGCQTFSGFTGSVGAPLPRLAGADSVKPRDAAKAFRSTARTLHQQGHHAEAASLLEKARAQDPNAYPYARHLAVLYDELQLDQKAENEFRQALKEQPQDADLWNDYGYFHQRCQRLAQAEEAFRKALEHAPNHQRARMNLATCLFHQNRQPEAYNEFATAVGPAAAHQNMGVLLVGIGNSAEAQVAFQQALAADPELFEARQFLTGMQQIAQSPQRSPVATYR